MPKILFLALLSALGFTAIQSAQRAGIGTVKSESGEPISDVLVCAKTYECLKTDSEGRYEIAKLLGADWEKIPRIWIFRISKQGYVPLIKTLKDTTSSLDAVLVKRSNASWELPPCSGKEKRQGFNIKVVVPKNTDIRKSSDADYFLNDLRFGKTKEWMRIGAGPTWSRGLPSKDDVENSSEVFDRDIRFPQSQVKGLPYAYIDGIDVRGQLMDGTRWRFTGNAFETLTYKTLSESAAKFFDSIIDTGCYQAPERDPQ